MKIKTFYSLEVLRFYAALVVFIGHYIHFPMYLNVKFSDETLPIPMFLKAFGYGGLAVPMFFMISGIIFTHMYANKIVNNEITYGKFFQRRFARLYPLHFLTLMLTLVFTLIIQEVSANDYFIYPHNDIKHFILNIFFMSNWGLEDGHSFNGPIWSVSNEVIFYCAFFVSLVLFRKWYLNNKLFPILVFVIVLLQYTGSTFDNASLALIQRNIFTFFMGCLLYQLIYKGNIKIAISITVAFTMITLFFPFAHHFVIKAGLTHGFKLIMFMSFVLLLERFNFFEKYLVESMKKFCLYIGNLTYSTYLVHIPIQMMMIIIYERYYEFDFFSVWTLVLYISLVFISGRLLFKYFESPAKQYINRIKWGRV